MSKSQFVFDDQNIGKPMLKQEHLKATPANDSLPLDLSSILLVNYSNRQFEQIPYSGFGKAGSSSNATDGPR